MFKTLLAYTILCIGLINTIHFGFYIVGANVYDMRELARRQKPKKRSKSLRPLITVIIPAHNEEMGVIRSLESIRKNTYRKVQILVVDDCSTDSTRKLVYRYIKEHPKLDVHLLRKQKNVGKGEALNHALRRMAKGDLVMTLDADSLLHRRAINNAVTHFDDPRVVGMAANVQIVDDGTILSMLQKVEHMIGYRSKKFYTLTNSEYIVGGVASTYRMDVIRQHKFYDTDTMTEDIGLSLKLLSLNGNKDQRIIYAADVLAMTEGVQTYKALFKQRYRWKMGMLQNLLKHRKMIGNPNKKYGKMLSIYRLPMAIFSELNLLLEPLLLGYVIYLGFVYHAPQIFLGAYLTITLYILWTVWPDEHMTNKHKLRVSVYAPLMYFVFYIMNLIQFVAVIRCLTHPKQVRRKVGTSAWTSPQRAGGSVSFG